MGKAKDWFGKKFKDLTDEERTEYYRRVSAEWYADHPGYQKAANEKWIENPENYKKWRDGIERWKEANKERHNKSVLDWQAANQEKVKAAKRRWYLKKKAERCEADAKMAKNKGLKPSD